MQEWEKGTWFRRSLGKDTIRDMGKGNRSNDGEFCCFQHILKVWILAVTGGRVRKRCIASLLVVNRLRHNFGEDNLSIEREQGLRCFSSSPLVSQDFKISCSHYLPNHPFSSCSSSQISYPDHAITISILRTY